MNERMRSGRPDFADVQRVYQHGWAGAVFTRADIVNSGLRKAPGSGAAPNGHGKFASCSAPTLYLLRRIGKRP